ncbi:4-alpha-glucanotransferase [Sphingomonas crocodyli]|uniref:4-alpha-glucanotransferase n=1 Tax=Sphingomonas crocodyli TaxID=1979270 RepID=A0A437LYF0_9SPHN|nr:4-alpha-glucanotransferase [Sphingomonas crocodyli]RVT90395.1 4-alpha-glucanotransferase [Sphingomonas crocodyli]
MTPLDRLARRVGVARHWRDADGVDQTVEDDALIAILTALGHPASDLRAINASLAAHDNLDRQPPVLLTADVAHSCPLPAAFEQASMAEIEFEDGTCRKLTVSRGRLPPLDRIGYHMLHVAGQSIKLAVAPSHCPLPPQRAWGAAVQIPSLRGDRTKWHGDFADLAQMVVGLAELGADVVALSPVHATIPGATHFSPYAPSSRLFANTGLIEAPRGDPGDGALIDWATVFDLARQSHRDAAHYGVSLPGPAETDPRDRLALARHALFDTLARRFESPDWRHWPPAYHDPAGEAATRVATQEAAAISRLCAAQARADDALGRAQITARRAGMAIGLISDLAVGVDPGGSDAWAMQGTMLEGVSIGAPPDPLGPDGQNWGLTSFSPAGLRKTGFAPWIAMVRRALAFAGGVRIDHAFGLARLWVIPKGETAQNGAYLHYPLVDLLRLLTLEADRVKAIVVAEDLGTPPAGFAQAAADRHMLGMRVLWFERDAAAFRDPVDFTEASVAMTGTHDTPTVAGWWSGRDLVWSRSLGRSGVEEAEQQRAVDRGHFWRLVGDAGPQPAPDAPERVVDAAIAAAGRAGSTLTIVPMEDLLGLEEQPNLPGTIDEHPNWRRRLGAPVDILCRDPDVQRRATLLNEGRRS